MTKSQFDSYRQAFWDRASAIVAAYERTSDISQKQQLMNNLNAELSAYKSTYEASRCGVGVGGTKWDRLAAGGCIEPEWIDSRFHDFYDPMLGYAQRWAAELANATVSGPSGNTSVLQQPGCTAGICGPVPSTTPLTTVQSGGAGAGGSYSYPISGGAVTIGLPATLPGGQSGLSPGSWGTPNPLTGDLPGAVPSALTPSGAQAAAGTNVGTVGSFDIVGFVKSPAGMIIAGALILILLMRKAG
jgi:hypothetical protein